MHPRALAALLAVSVLGCDTAPTSAELPRSFVATGAYNVRYWSDASVPGSLATRPGTRLPMYFVCEVPDDATARAAAVLTDAQLALYDNGSALLTLGVGTWLQREGTVASSGETISRYGNWSEGADGRVTLSGFNVPGLGQELRYTDLGHAELALTLACPGGTADAMLTPTLTFARVR